MIDIEKAGADVRSAVNNLDTPSLDSLHRRIRRRRNRRAATIGALSVIPVIVLALALGTDRSGSSQVNITNDPPVPASEVSDAPPIVDPDASPEPGAETLPPAAAGTTTTSPLPPASTRRLRPGSDVIPVPVLVDLPGWRLDAVSTDVNGGLIRFGGPALGGNSGAAAFSVQWAPGSDLGSLHAQSLEDLGGVAATPVAAVSVLGQPAETFVTDNAAWGFLTAGDFALLVTGSRMSLADFVVVAGALDGVGVDVFLAALPASQATPARFAAWVDERTPGVPKPPAFDLGALDAAHVLVGNFEAGREAAGQLVCGWLDVWVIASTGGDQAGAVAATHALTLVMAAPIWSEIDDAYGQETKARTALSQMQSIDETGSAPAPEGGLPVTHPQTVRDLIGYPCT